MNKELIMRRSGSGESVIASTIVDLTVGLESRSNDDSYGYVELGKVNPHASHSQIGNIVPNTFGSYKIWQLKSQAGLGIAEDTLILNTPKAEFSTIRLTRLDNGISVILPNGREKSVYVPNVGSTNMYVYYIDNWYESSDLEQGSDKVLLKSPDNGKTIRILIEGLK